MKLTNIIIIMICLIFLIVGCNKKVVDENIIPKNNVENEKINNDLNENLTENKEEEIPQKEIINTSNIKEESPIIKTNETEESEEIKPDSILDNEIIIENNQIAKRDLTIKKGVETKLTFYNADDVTYKLSIEMYGNFINEDIKPKSRIEVIVNPKHKGIVPIKLNYVQRTNLFVEE